MQRPRSAAGSPGSGIEKAGERRRASANGPWIEIVGIARDSKYVSLSEAASPVIYVPLAQQHETGVVLYVRASG